MKKISMILLSTILTGLNTSGQNKIETIKLDNGLTVILNEDNRDPKVFGVVLTKVGGKNDAWDATGMAHYMEHMLFKGTTQLGTSDWEKEKPHIDKIICLYDSLGKTSDDNQRKEIHQAINKESVEASKYSILNEMSNIIHKMGGTKLNAFTSPDVTAFFNEFPPNQINQWIDLYAHRFTNPVFRAFQAELEVVYEEKNMYEDQFQTKLFESFNKYMFKKHPYGQRSLIGTTEDLKNPSLSKMYEFYRTWYVANNMVLVLSGDFETSEIIPVITEKFGQLPTRNIPKPIIYSEEPFKGRELVQEKLSPIKMNLMGFRTPPEGDSDKIIMDVIAKMLNNSTQTGYLDQLSLDNKLLAAHAVLLPYHDYGSLLILAMPKLVGQKLESAENLVLEQLKRLAEGDFADDFLETIKSEFYREQQLMLESLQGKAISLAFASAQNLDLNEVFNQTERIKNISKEDIQAITQKYLGDNYLILQSRMGSPKKDKIEKPNFKPIATNTNHVSAYQKQFDKIPKINYNPSFIDFSIDIESEQLSKNYTLHINQNPINDIFTMSIQFGIGKIKAPYLEYAVQYMNFAGLEFKTLNDVRLEFAKYGASYSFEISDDYTTIEIEGIEKNLPHILALLNKLINEPYPDNSKINVIYEGEKAQRKMETEQLENVAHALGQYALYGPNSKYLKRPSLRKIKRLKAEDLISDFKTATEYDIHVFYTGQKDIVNVKTHINNNLRFSSEIKPSESPSEKNSIDYTEDVVFFTNMKKATQSKILLTSKCQINKVDYALLTAFNVYLGGGFSGILVQEVREYRSLAYNVGGGFPMPKIENNPVHFNATLGTQTDKTIEALTLVDSIIKSLPQKPERLEMIKEYLINKTITDKPGFRDYHHKIQEWKYQGYSEDPAIDLLEQYRNLTWEQLYSFYQRVLKGNNFVISITGDKSKIDMNQLKQFGKVIEIKESKLFSK
ncbi:MAG: insulinase family protein [Salinivirgaceae bacterium]|nr:insulinase family protein [Salinivirgaceae bacterium]